jgi:hypothetical protein
MDFQSSCATLWPLVNILKKIDWLAWTKKNKKKKLRKKPNFCWHLESLLKKEQDTGSVNQQYGSADPDPYRNLTEPQH